MSWLPRCSAAILMVSVAWAQPADRALRSIANAPPASGAATIVKSVKASPFYRDSGVEENSNWLSRALEKLANLFHRPENRAIPNYTPAPWLGTLLNVLVWTFLAVAVAIFAYYAIRHYQWRVGLRRQARAIVEEDEPDRSADEWLRLADEYEGKGDFRRAVRCLYLACLLRLDEARIARFDRGQTNWEHLARIRSSPKMPTSLDFVTPTKDFDRIWYGQIVEGRSDVERFRSVYLTVKELTEAVPA